MNSAVRWRIISIQAVLVLVLAFCSGFLFYEGVYVTGQVHDELASQKIFFPPSSTIVAGGALDPAEFPQEIRDQAGNQVTDGNQARIYADDFIGKHLLGVAGGQTYAQVSTQAQAVGTQLAADPSNKDLQAQNTKLQGQVATLFKGEMLRATLLNSFGWWTLGIYATYAGIGLLVAALAVLGALVFELFIAGRRPTAITVAQSKAA
jgi:hypothetical protein